MGRVAEDVRVKVAADAAVTATVEHFDGMALIPTKWTRLESEYNKMLKEAEEGPDFNEQVLEAITAVEERNGLSAGALLESIRKQLTGDRKDRRDTLKEMRSLYDNQIQAMARLEELKQNKIPLEKMEDWQIAKQLLTSTISGCAVCSARLQHLLEGGNGHKPISA